MEILFLDPISHRAGQMDQRSNPLSFFRESEQKRSREREVFYGFCIIESQSRRVAVRKSQRETERKVF